MRAFAFHLRFAMSLHSSEKSQRRRLWRAGVLKQPRLAKHVQARVENVRKLVLLITRLDQEKQHVRIMRRSLRSRLQKGEITLTAYENELSDAEETLKTLQEKWKLLKADLK